MTTYQYKANSYAAPFFSDTYEGFIEAETAMDALRAVVAKYKRIYSVGIYECTPANKRLAQYLSKEAHTASAAGCGSHHYESGVLYVDGKEATVLPEVFEEAK